MDSHVSSPEIIALGRFIESLKEIAAGVISKPIVSDFLLKYQPRREELRPYETWLPDRHTRNLIFRNEMIELMLVCWNIGNTTPLHTHNGQLGWMAMIQGKLLVENFRLRSCNKPENQEVVGIDCLAGATEIDMQKLDTEISTPGGLLNTVDKHHTIHKITNLAEWNEPAVSLHIYSKPIESCVVFDLDAQRCYRRELSYDNQ